MPAIQASLRRHLVAGIAACAAAAAVHGGPSACAITEVTPDGVWACMSDPRAFCDAGRLHMGWVTKDGDVQAASYRLDDGEVFICDLAPEFEPDEHDAPAFFVTSDGRCTGFFSKHAQPRTTVRYRTTAGPFDIASWLSTRETCRNTPGFGGVTYPSPYAYPGETDHIFLFWRGGDWRPNYCEGAYDPLDSTWEWSACQDLIAVPLTRPYVKYASASDGRIGIAFTDGHPRDVRNNIYYAEIRADGGAAAFFRPDGTRIKSLSDGALLRAEADTIFDRLADPDVTGGNAMIWDLTFDEADRPVVAFVSFPSRDHHQYHWARFDGSAWEDDIVVWDAGGSVSDTTIGTPEYYTSGGIVLDRCEPRVIYVSVENSYGGFDIDRMRRDDSGPSWTTTAVTEGALCDNLRPIAPENRPPDLDMVLWVSGSYDYWMNTLDERDGEGRDTVYNYDTSVLLWTSPASSSAGDELPGYGSDTASLRAGPNPFMTTAEICFTTGEAGRVDLAVYDVSGRLVRFLIAGARLAGGNYRAEWDGTNGFGVRAASGVYFVRLSGPFGDRTSKVVFVR